MAPLDFYSLPTRSFGRTETIPIKLYRPSRDIHQDLVMLFDEDGILNPYLSSKVLLQEEKFWELAMPVKKENTQGSSLPWECQDLAWAGAQPAESRKATVLPAMKDDLQHAMSPTALWAPILAGTPRLTTLHWSGLCLRTRKTLLTQVRCLYVSRNKKSGLSDLELLQRCLYSWSTISAHGFLSSHRIGNTSWHLDPIPGRKKGEKQTAFSLGVYLYLRREGLPIDLCLHIKRIMSVVPQWQKEAGNVKYFLSTLHNKQKKGRRSLE